MVIGIANQVLGEAGVDSLLTDFTLEASDKNKVFPTFAKASGYITNVIGWIRGYWVNWKPESITCYNFSFNPAKAIEYRSLIVSGNVRQAFSDESNYNNSKILI